MIIVFFGVVSARSADEREPDSIALKPRYGVSAAYNLNFHAADFRSLPGVPSCCPKFGGGSGTGFALGALYERPLDRDLFINVRASFATFNAELSKVENVNVIVEDASYPGKFEHRLDASIASLGIEPMASYRFFENIFAHAGFRVALPIATDFEQIEEIVDPADRGVFVDSDGKRTRNDTSGSISDAAMQIAFQIGASRDFPLNKNRSLFISPQIFYQALLTPVVSGRSWNIHSIQIGAAIKYREPPPPPPPPPPPLEEPFPRDLPMPEAPPALEISIRALGLDSLGKTIGEPDIRIEDFVSLNMRPLLNYIFFNENSAEIPDRYKLLDKGETGDFSLKKLHTLDALETYYHVLNIIGKRLSERPSAKIELVGSNANVDDEKNNKELSRQRAENVRDYFRDVWGVDESRLEITARNLPRQPSSTDEEGGVEENRRVEIIPSDDALLEPVVTIDTLRELTKTTVRFLPKTKSDIGIKNWRITVRQNGNELKSYSGASKLPDKIDWEIISDKKTPLRGGKILYKLEVEDDLGRKFKTPERSFEVEQLTISKKRLENIKDKEFEYYSLILFDFGSSNLESEHKKVVDFVKNRITPNAKVYIYGYTDMLGDEDVNKRISTSRAKSVARRLNIPDAKVVGIGETPLLFDNSLPEGRFYCRTVNITIETPVKELDE